LGFEEKGIILRHIVGYNTGRVLYLFLFFFGQVKMVNTLKLEDRLEGETKLLGLEGKGSPSIGRE
jgi:hypothetical protein